ncbi:MAG TPA: DUF2127 domain-containing protein [Solirubrobacteraceae bacterium]|jgi:uncharacterized membrane protein (DUF2068 family)|nr:DUF2127 domain-containing protein [Solirubrobacteraceae bacterium]
MGTGGTARPRAGERGHGGHSDRLLPWIAAERTLRAVVLLAAGLVLVTHPHSDWASEISRLAQRLGLNPKDNWIQRLIDKIKKIHAHEDVVFGVAALAYGALEATEAYGLFRRRAWGEWLTVFATSVLIVPEVWELTKSTTALKLGALAVNVAVVAYLVWRLRRARRA